MSNTVLRAEKKQDSCTITFKNKEHEKFYKEYLTECRYQDIYRKALVYYLGIDRDTKELADQIYDFRTGNVKPERRTVQRYIRLAHWCRICLPM